MKQHQKRIADCSSCRQVVENFEPLHLDSTTGAYCCHQESPHVRPIPNILNVGQCNASGGYKSVWQPSQCFENSPVIENYEPVHNKPVARPIPRNFVYQPTYYTDFDWDRGINGAGRSCCQGGCNGCKSCGNDYAQYFSNACYGNSCNF